MWETTMYYDETSGGHSVWTDLEMAVRLHREARKLGYQRIVTVKANSGKNNA